MHLWQMQATSPAGFSEGAQLDDASCRARAVAGRSPKGSAESMLVVL